ncbi:MAG TPA: hypothetical protein VKB38_25045 [Terracidiphilus sp.]|nr:hypothetical protein [Terracidiphilus sp.]
MIVTCNQCGSVVKLTKHNLTFVDRDRVECECGNVLHEWKGSYTYSPELVAGPNAAPDDAPGSE